MSDESGNKPTREELIGRFLQEISRMSTWSVMFHQAASLRMGLNPTDGKCLGVLRETGPIPAGELAEITGLTTGAITGVIDRLEKHGLVRRAADTQDRRRVVIEPIPQATQTPEVAEIFGPLAETTINELLRPYNDDELALVLDFVQRGADLMKGQTARLRRLK